MEDREAIGRVLSGDAGAYAILVKKHQTMAFTLAFRITGNREEAEEIAQDAFVKAYRSLPAFRQDSKFSSWLYRIVYNQAVSGKRKKVIQAASFDDMDGEWNEPAEATGALDRLTAGERKRYISRVLETLNPVDAALVTLYYMEDTDVAGISEITGLSHSNVKVRLHRSRKKLHDELQNMLKGEEHNLLSSAG